MKKPCIIFILLILFPVFLTAQTMILDWADVEAELEIQIPGETQAFGVNELYDFGIDIYTDGLPAGSVVFTHNTYAEFYLNPNGSILKLSRNTEFSIYQLDDSEGNGSNEFTLAGKLRMVAAKATGSKKSKYNIRTESVICGVRGTDFILDSAEGNAYLKEGLINLTNEATGKSIDLGPGQGSNLFGDDFAMFDIDADALNQIFEDMSFKNLKPEDVPPAFMEGTPGEGPETEGPPDVPKEPSDEETPEPGVNKDEKKENAFTKFLREHLGFEIGSITIDGDTYAKAVIQPAFTIGKLGLALYLPIVYKENMFDPDDWYHPDGNDEWSFGTDKEGFGNIVGDILADLFLKIKYIKWGDNRDKFYFKAGNLDDMTIGHGMLMKDYSNDANFPAVRKVGINTGLDLGNFGFEAVVTDMSDIEIFGGRLYFKPGGKLAVGISSIVDINPQDSVDLEETTDTYGDPIFVNVGLDLDLPIISGGGFSLIAFTDAALMIPYLREDAVIGGETVGSGIHFDAFINPNPDLAWKDKIKNYGIKAGLMGNIAVVQWLAEFRFFNGTFRPAFFDSTYDRLRGQYVVETLQYLATLDNMDSSEPDYNLGVYGELKWPILKKINIELGYMFPWQYENDRIEVGDRDFLHVGLSIARGTIPFLKIHGSIFYDRTYFIPTLAGRDGFEDFSLFDANTVFGGEIVYEIVPTLDLALLVTTTVNDDNEAVPSIGIETRVHF